MTFLSVVIVVRNQVESLEKILLDVTTSVSSLVRDYEIIVIDNASHDNSVLALKNLTQEKGQPNLQVYALTKEVDTDTASWVGLENALGDFVAVIDPWLDDMSVLPDMLQQSLLGADVVFASNEQQIPKSLAYRWAYHAFNRLYKWLHGVDLAKEAPKYRILHKKVVNFMLQHPQPSMAYHHLPATGGFSRINLQYNAKPKAGAKRNLIESIDLGVKLLVSTTRVPMRLVTSLSLFGAIANLLYSVYIVAIGFFKTDVAPGWISLSLQQSGMFFLISLVLLVLGEYIVHMASLSNEGPLYHIGQEFTSARMTRREKLNIEEISDAITPAAPGTYHEQFS